jgi:hypothetical protein
MIVMTDKTRIGKLNLVHHTLRSFEREWVELGGRSPARLRFCGHWEGCCARGKGV